VNIRHLQLPLALALALGASSAQALGLGQIQVKSGLNEPLVAEIPILSAAPGEVEELEVRLASPEAFARVGLERPVGMTANLQMSVGRNAAGQPVIRVTTPARFTEPVLTFLVEANWGRGSLVREFSALVDPPYIAPAVIRPLDAPSVSVAPAPVAAPTPLRAPEAQTAAIEEPAPATVVADIPPAPQPEPTPEPAPVTELPPEPVAAAPAPPAEPDPIPEPVAAQPEPLPEPEPLAAEPEPAPLPEPVPQPEPEPEPEPEPIAAIPPPAPAPAPEPTPVAEPVDPGSFGPVAEGQTLWTIADQNKPDPGVSISQMMLALQRANPEAFIDDNINQLKRGAVLRIPARDEVTTLGVAEAEALVREQATAWQSRRQPVPQPAESVASEPAPAVAAPPRAEARRPAATPDGRLEIVPPSGDESAARGVQSGASGTGTGSELRAELTQTREDLAAREAEVSELRSQLAELDQQQADSQRLIQLQDSQMKALQERLGQPAPVPAPSPAPAPDVAANAPAATPAATAVDVPQPWYLNPFVLGGGGLVLLGGLVLALRGRRSASPMPSPGRRISDDDALHASLASARNDRPESMGPDRGDVDEVIDEAPQDAEQVRLAAAVAARPDDLEAHISLLRHHYARGDRTQYDSAAQAMRDRVRSTLDPRWREAVVMGVALSPDNPVFSQAGWNSPRFGDTGVMPATPPVAAAAMPAPVDIADLEGLELDVPATPASTAVEEQDEEWDRLAIAASGASGDADAVPVPVDLVGVEVDGPDDAESDDGSGTKIELAKAYLDIGDIEGAKGMLEEVLAEAGPAGRAEAERLLKEIG
jgi:pilus assembly protein FimV